MHTVRNVRALDSPRFRRMRRTLATRCRCFAVSARIAHSLRRLCRALSSCVSSLTDPVLAHRPRRSVLAQRLVMTPGQELHTPSTLREHVAPSRRQVHLPHRLRMRGKSTPEKRHATHPRAAFTDFLTATFPFAEGSARRSLFFEQLAITLGEVLGGAADRRRGLHGFHESFAFENGAAMFAYEGQRGRAMLSLPGEACALMPSWPAFAPHFYGTR